MWGWAGGWVGVGWGGYDQLCCPASPKLLLGLDLGLGWGNISCLLFSIIDTLSRNTLELIKTINQHVSFYIMTHF